MRPSQTVHDLRCAPSRVASFGSRWLAFFGLTLASCLSPELAFSQETSLAFPNVSDTVADSAVPTAPLLWSAEEVVAKAIQADPVRMVLIHERRLAQSQRSGHKSNCAVDHWVAYHLDQRIARREQEVRAQALKLHFGLAEVQSQTLVVDSLQQLLTQYTAMVSKVAEVEEATDTLEQTQEELITEIRSQESTLQYSLAQIRAQLLALLQCEESQHYWPTEPLLVEFQAVDVEQQVALAKQQRSDVSVWNSIPRIEGNAEELAKVEKLLAASWLVVPTSAVNTTMLKLLAHNRIQNDLKRQWSIRKQQIQELARAKTLEMETEVRLKALALNQAYRVAEEAQLTKQQAETRLDTLQKRQELGVAQPDRYWSAAFEFQRTRSIAFRRLSEARQAEIDLDFATGSHRVWLNEQSQTNDSIEQAEAAVELEE